MDDSLLRTEYVGSVGLHLTRRPATARPSSSVQPLSPYSRPVSARPRRRLRGRETSRKRLPTTLRGRAALEPPELPSSVFGVKFQVEGNRREYIRLCRTYLNALREFGRTPTMKTEEIRALLLLADSCFDAKAMGKFKTCAKAIRSSYSCLTFVEKRDLAPAVHSFLSLYSYVTSPRTLHAVLHSLRQLLDANAHRNGHTHSSSLHILRAMVLLLIRANRVEEARKVVERMNGLQNLDDNAKCLCARTFAAVAENMEDLDECWPMYEKAADIVFDVKGAVSDDYLALQSRMASCGSTGSEVVVISHDDESIVSPVDNDGEIKAKIREEEQRLEREMEGASDSTTMKMKATEPNSSADAYVSAVSPTKGSKEGKEESVDYNVESIVDDPNRREVKLTVKDNKSRELKKWRTEQVISTRRRKLYEKEQEPDNVELEVDENHPNSSKEQEHVNNTTEIEAKMSSEELNDEKRENHEKEWSDTHEVPENEHDAKEVTGKGTNFEGSEVSEHNSEDGAGSNSGVENENDGNSETEKVKSVKNDEESSLSDDNDGALLPKEDNGVNVLVESHTEDANDESKCTMEEESLEKDQNIDSDTNVTVKMSEENTTGEFSEFQPSTGEEMNDSSINAVDLPLGVAKSDSEVEESVDRNVDDSEIQDDESEIPERKVHSGDIIGDKMNASSVGDEYNDQVHVDSGAEVENVPAGDEQDLEETSVEKLEYEECESRVEDLPSHERDHEDSQHDMISANNDG